MLIKFQIIIGILSLILLLITFELIRKERLREEYSILWLFTGGVTLVLSFWPQFFLSKFLTQITGLYLYSSSVEMRLPARSSLPSRMYLRSCRPQLK